MPTGLNDGRPIEMFGLKGLLAGLVRIRQSK
jgi:hypothetical protein